MKENHISKKHLSDKAKINRHTFNRKLQAEDFSFAEIRRLYDAAGVNWHCAILAIEYGRDWRLYDSHTIEIASTFAELLPVKIHEAIERDIQPIKYAAISQLVQEIANRIAKHDNAVIIRCENL